jgi:hypothetical protein
LGFDFRAAMIEYTHVNTLPRRNLLIWFEIGLLHQQVDQEKTVLRIQINGRRKKSEDRKKCVAPSDPGPSLNVLIILVAAGV